MGRHLDKGERTPPLTPTLPSSSSLGLHLSILPWLPLLTSFGIPSPSLPPSPPCPPPLPAPPQADKSAGSWGDVHYYNYDADCEDASTYPSARFISEHGFQVNGLLRCPDDDPLR